MSQNQMAEKLAEITEQCGHVAKLFIKAEMCLKNGDLTSAQKHTKEAQHLLSVMKKDVFIEIAECFEIETEDCAEIEDISTLELAKHMCEITYNAGVLTNLMLDNVSEKICGSIKQKLMAEVNASIKLYDAIFEN